MAQQSLIEWTDATWPIVQGCDPVSPGCANCYVPRVLIRHAANPNPKISLPVKDLVTNKGRLRFTGKVALREDRMTWPLKWYKSKMIFVPSHGDLFHDDVPEDFILRTFDIMRRCTWAGGQNCGLIKGSGHTFQVLTKRIERAAGFCSRLRWDGNRLFLGDSGGQLMLPTNSQIWLGTSVEDQKRADERIPHLLKCPAAVRFLSVEPLLSEINLNSRKPVGVPSWWQGQLNPLSQIDWVIVGAESGPGRRPMSLDWARSLRDQCAAAGVAFPKAKVMA